MATKKLDVVVAASSTGVAGVVGDLDRISQAARKAAASGGPGGGARSAGQQGFFKTLGPQAHALGLGGDNSIIGLLRGTGALFAVAQVGRALQGLPEEIDKFRANLRTGGTVLESFATGIADSIPVIGDLAKGIRYGGDALDDWVKHLVTGAKTQSDIDQEETERKQMRERARKFEEERVKILSDNNEALKREKRAAFGDSFQGRIDDLEKERLNRVRLRPDQREQFDKDLAERGRLVNRERDVAREKQRASFDDQILGLKEELLGELGLQSDLETRRTHIIRDAVRQEQQLKDQLRDPNLPESQRKMLGAVLEALPAVTRERIANLREGEPGPNRAPLENTRFLTGTGQSVHNAKVERTGTAILELLRRIHQIMRGTTTGVAAADGSIF